ncbi:helix-turn-helix domain-containing protein [Flammeovirga sp. SJP92]|uniref:helix-turn-helix domain-containing protein n=1 Tax=Flammeovirga sp. SJP92 TaxID=1775430 RepID=UPI000786A510|nr:helix-turn-helix domain-containing protein [Flammeovirga sp. SJP92]KXX67439.1 hypothetical protein AVL50_29595 [Flammeovirga sp. SJP92]KXX72723.1 hypothetical protein AVL50_32285 [Flammeovirga sp. SJP92]
MSDIAIRKKEKSQFSTPLEIIHLDDVLMDKDMKEGLHRHDFFFLMALEEANGQHHIDFVHYPIDANTLFIIRPGQVHELVLQQRSKGYLIAFDAHLFNEDKELLRKVSQQNHYKFTSHNFKSIVSIFENIDKEYSKKELKYQAVIKANLEILFVLLHRNMDQKIVFHNRSNIHEQEILEEFIYLLENQTCPNKQVIEYAEILNISSNKLNSITKKLVGKKCSQLIQEQTLLEAKRLLLSTSHHINEIAFKLCFNDPAYFIRFFKKHTHYTPNSFRQQSQ